MKAGHSRWRYFVGMLAVLFGISAVVLRQQKTNKKDL